MGISSSDGDANPAFRRRMKAWIRKGTSLVVVGVLFGWLYGWAAPRFYGPGTTAGFWHGVLHGALMPVALPSLLLGQDVPVFAENHSGRFYKIGYIGGVNLCGLIFFGLAFRRSGGGQDPADTSKP